MKLSNIRVNMDALQQRSAPVTRGVSLSVGLSERNSFFGETWLVGDKSVSIMAGNRS